MKKLKFNNLYDMVKVYGVFETAKKLGVSRNLIYYYLKKHGINLRKLKIE